MQSVFDMPLPTREFRRTYGAFFVHCGGTAMGSPGVGDNHMPHGELPNIVFDSASLVLGETGGRVFLELTGTAHDREAFSHAYAFRPRLRFFEDAADIEACIEIENVGGAAMPFMYLAHVNFRPVGSSRIVDGLSEDSQIAWRKPGLPPEASPRAHAWHDAVLADPSRHRTIGADDVVEPEFVATLRLPSDGAGWAHALQVLPDGSADYVSYRPAELPFGIRWMTRAPERQALGIILPATAGPEGREAARQAGHLRYLQPGETFAASIRFGVLEERAAARLVSVLQ